MTVVVAVGLTCNEQDETNIGDDVKEEIENILQFNRNNPSQKLAKLSEARPPLPDSDQISKM